MTEEQSFIAIEVEAASRLMTLLAAITRCSLLPPTPEGDAAPVVGKAVMAALVSAYPDPMVFIKDVGYFAVTLVGASPDVRNSFKLIEGMDDDQVDRFMKRLLKELNGQDT
jgi:hypothetical protein